jgi:dienelactone hydrolase
MVTPLVASVRSSEVRIPALDLSLDGTLEIPPEPRGIVLFAHGSGSSRHSPRNRLVAGALHEAGIATLLFDLLARDEDCGYEKRFDIALLARRLRAATDWAVGEPATRTLPLGYFGASTGAAAALVAAAARPDVAAIVCRGGRPDLAGATALAAVVAPTLMLVGGEDLPVIALNRAAAAQMRCEHSLVIVPGATHLFEEPGALERVASLAGDWFSRAFDRAGTRT